MHLNCVCGTCATVGTQRISHWHAGDGALPLFLEIRESSPVSSAVKVAYSILLGLFGASPVELQTAIHLTLNIFPRDNPCATF